MENFDRIFFIIYTNENNLPLSEVTLNEFLNHTPQDIKIKVVTNNIPDNISLNKPDLFYNANIPQKNGKQFSSVMIKFLESINEEYIVFNCDDYILYKTVEKSDFNNLIDLMDHHNVDYFSFDKKLYCDTRTFATFENNFYENNLINVISDDHFYRYSVQPCVWRKSSLLKLLNRFGEIGVHDLETNDEIRKTNFLTLGVNWDRLGISIPSDPGYTTHFCYSWAEVIRSGVFISNINGFPVNESDYNCVIIRELIDKYNMCNEAKFNKIMHKMKNEYCK